MEYDEKFVLRIKGMLDRRCIRRHIIFNNELFFSFFHLYPVKDELFA
jgi:hypothetical protein